MSGCSSPVNETMCDGNCRTARMGDYDMRVVSDATKTDHESELRRPHIVMPQKSNEFSIDSLNASVNYENERAASREEVSANPFADQGAHCRPWSPASLFSGSSEMKLLDAAVMGDANQSWI